MPNPIVKCKVANCVHNMNGKQCTAANISIFNDESIGNATSNCQTQCESFEENTLGNMVTSLGNSNISGAVTSMMMDGTQLTPHVRCYVNSCAYWTANNMCEASEISVDGHNASRKADTDCKTYKKKTGV